MNRGSPLKCSLPEAPYYEIVQPPSAVMAALNLQFQTDAANSLYFTMVYGVINTRSHTLELCQAGHPHPIYLAQGEPAQFIGEGGFPVGIAAFAEFESIRLNYRAGDRLFIYSDGITECMSPAEEMFGPERLLAFVGETRHLPLGEALKRLEERIRLWRGDDAFEDDISMLALEMFENA
jgi:sigma-B regulation protein RsbU (phosphoserine phosphatase)